MASFLSDNNVLKYKIELPSEGIIIGFESLIIDQNKYMQKGTTITTTAITEYLNYSPHIMYFYDDKVDSFTFRGNKWIRQNLSKTNSGETLKVLTPAINLILTN